MGAWFWIASSLFIGAVGVLGDFFIKKASENGSLASPMFVLGFCIYAVTAIGWFFVMQHVKLAAVGVYYAIGSILLLSLIGFVFFKETLGVYEILGICLAIVSLLLLARFS